MVGDDYFGILSIIRRRVVSTDENGHLFTQCQIRSQIELNYDFAPAVARPFLPLTKHKKNDTLSRVIES
jgi:hypothetical protein